MESRLSAPGRLIQSKLFDKNLLEKPNQAERYTRNHGSFAYKRTADVRKYSHISATKCEKLLRHGRSTESSQWRKTVNKLRKKTGRYPSNSCYWNSFPPVVWCLAKNFTTGLPSCPLLATMHPRFFVEMKVMLRGYIRQKAMRSYHLEQPQSSRLTFRTPSPHLLTFREDFPW